MTPIVPLLVAAVLASSAVVAPPAPMQAPATPATPATDEIPSFNASDLDALRPNVGKEVEITGTVTNSGHGKSGNPLFLNFAGAHKGVVLVFFVGKGGADAGGADAGAAKKAQSEDDIKPFVGKSISVKGKLADYKGDLQIVVNTLDQIKVKEEK